MNNINNKDYGRCNHMSSCYLEIQTGAGGLDAQEWTSILLKMYMKSCSIIGFQTSLINASYADVGLRSAVLFISALKSSKHDNPYILFKNEIGSHRLVRISPFSANRKRHTSFASVLVYPFVNEVDIVINPKDLVTHTFRASGAGGQHVNKTDSAVRIVHTPTGLRAESQAQRSQHSNKVTAMSCLRSKIKTYYSDISKDAANTIKGSHINQVVFGLGSNAVRSYIEDKDLINDINSGQNIRGFKKMVHGGTLLTTLNKIS